MLVDLTHRLPHSGALLVLSLVTLIAVGTLILLFSGASPEGQQISFLDAVFTATSAASLTGLQIRDTATEISPFGQVVIAVSFN